MYNILLLLCDIITSITQSQVILTTMPSNQPAHSSLSLMFCELIFLEGPQQTPTYTCDPSTFNNPNINSMRKHFTTIEMLSKIHLAYGIYVPAKRPL